MYCVFSFLERTLPSKTQKSISSHAFFGFRKLGPGDGRITKQGSTSASTAIGFGYGSVEGTWEVKEGIGEFEATGLIQVDDMSPSLQVVRIPLE